MASGSGAVTQMLTSARRNRSSVAGAVDGAEVQDARSRRRCSRAARASARRGSGAPASRSSDRRRWAGCAGPGRVVATSSAAALVDRRRRRRAAASRGRAPRGGSSRTGRRRKRRRSRPSCAKKTPRLTASSVLPTPPRPPPMAMIFRPRAPSTDSGEGGGADERPSLLGGSLSRGPGGSVFGTSGGRVSSGSRTGGDYSRAGARWRKGFRGGDRAAARARISSLPGTVMT